MYESFQRNREQYYLKKDDNYIVNNTNETEELSEVEKAFTLVITYRDDLTND